MTDNCMDDETALSVENYKLRDEVVDLRAINESQADQIAVIYAREERLTAALKQIVDGDGDAYLIARRALAGEKPSG